MPSDPQEVLCASSCEGEYPKHFSYFDKPTDNCSSRCLRLSLGKCASRVVMGMVGSCTYFTRCSYLRSGLGAPGAHFCQHLTRRSTLVGAQSGADPSVRLFLSCAKLWHYIVQDILEIYLTLSSIIRYSFKMSA